MGLLDDLQLPEKVWTCRVRTIYNELEGKDQAIFEQAVNDPAWKAETLSKALTQRGIKIAGSGITRHRMKECSCSKVGN